MSYEGALKTAIEAAMEAGELLRREFHRSGGPRGHSAHADADEEAEWLIRRRLQADYPQYAYRGEETGTAPGTEDFVWLVDPNDGTSGFLRGSRGSSVSIGLVTRGIPVLGVVYAFVAPDDRGDLVCWAEGCELERNGKPIRPGWISTPANQVLIVCSMHRESATDRVLEVLRPYRYRPYPSIAYRMALAAAGDASAVVSWHTPGDWDYGGGHALLRGAGGIFVNEDGIEVTYAEDGASRVKRCFGGHPAVVQDLVGRDWSRLQAGNFPQTSPPTPYGLSRSKPGEAIVSPELLSRAQGALIGQCAGDALGQLVEFQTAAAIRARYPNGVTQLEDGGAWNTIAGQPTDDTEMALMLARSIVANDGYDHVKAATAYHFWFESGPFDIGNTISSALVGVTAEDVQGGTVAESMMRSASPYSQANGSLMRISPLGIYGYRKLPDLLWRLACEDSALTHPHPVCQQACALFVTAIAQAIRTGDPPSAIYQNTLFMAEESAVEPSLLDVLRKSADSVPQAEEHQGWILIAFQNAFYQLLHASSFENGVIDSVMLGGDTDTNAAIAGALLGAVYGRAAVPAQWFRMIISCRPHPAIHARHPRPTCFWPVDVPVLAERLLLAG